jgi:hypothetical protein
VPISVRERPGPSVATAPSDDGPTCPGAHPGPRRLKVGSIGYLTIDQMTAQEETDEGIEQLRRQKMATLKAAREAYRRRMAEPLPPSGSVFKGQIDALHAAVKSADADLRQFNEEHPRP